MIEMKTIEEIVIDALEPTFFEWLDMSFDWEGYHHELAFLMGCVSYSFSQELFIEDINFSLMYPSNTFKYTAACDVASTLESLAPEKYAGKFRYYGGVIEGSFKTEGEAINAYDLRKRELANELASKQSNKTVADAILARYN